MPNEEIRSVTTEGSSSLERIIPDELRADEATGSETLKFHSERYEFARTHIRPGRVLDLACGAGYGTAILAGSPQISDAVGVDISTSAVEYAIKRYGNSRISFVCLAAREFAPNEKFENVVSLETIEHVDDPYTFFSQLVSLVKPEGRLIASVPVTPSVDANPHHKSNFTERRFRRLGDAHGLKCLDSLLQIQRFNPFAVATRREERTRDLRADISAFYLKHPSHFVLRVWSTLRDGFANKYLTIVWEKRD